MFFVKNFSSSGAQIIIWIDNNIETRVLQRRIQRVCNTFSEPLHLIMFNKVEMRKSNNLGGKSEEMIFGDTSV